MFVSDILSSAASLLNDRDKVTWTDAVLLPYYQKAHKEIVQAYENNGSPILKEVSALTTVAIGEKTITTITDIRTPLKLFERASGSSDKFKEMRETDWEPEDEPGDTLKYWNWREGVITLLGATTARQVKLRYIKTIEAPNSANSTVVVPEAELFLASRTAALAAGLSGGNFERASALASDAEVFKFGTLNNQTQGLQGSVIRKRGYRR